MTKRLKIHKARIDELSAVDRPAQAGALVTIMKRADPLSSAIQKALEENAGNGDQAVIDSIQSLLTKAANGGKQSDEDDMPTDNPADKDAAKKKLDDMQKSLDSVNAQLKKAQALAELNDAEKSFYKSLDADKQDAFLAKSAEGRTQEVEMHKAADPVVYTSDSGEVFRKSAGDQLVAMAKRVDAAERMAKADREAAQMERFSKRASDEMPNIAGEASAKVAFYKHLDGASDEVKGFAAAMIKSHNELLSKSATMTGTKAGADADSEANAGQKLVKMAKAHAKEHDVDYDTAYLAVCEQNPDLYEQA